LPHATILLWGLDLIQVFNEGYKPLLGSRAFSALGQPAKHLSPEGWAANWDVYREMFASTVDFGPNFTIHVEVVE
jgi:hypothetical protein